MKPKSRSVQIPLNMPRPLYNQIRKAKKTLNLNASATMRLAIREGLPKVLARWPRT